MITEMTIAKREYDMKIVDLGNIVQIENDIIEKANVTLELTDYGDRYYDLHFVVKGTDDLVGGCALCGISGLDKARRWGLEMLEDAGMNHDSLVMIRG
jgi:hypothetical protein